MGRGRRGTGPYRPLQDVSGEHFGAPAASSPMFHKPWDLGHPGTRRIRGDVPQTPGFVTGWNMAEEEDLMTLGDGLAEETPGLESVLELRLMALLTDMVRNHGMGGAAERLGVSRQTLWRARVSGTLPPSLLAALERLARESDEAAAAAQRERTEVLERRVEAWKKEVGAGLQQLRSAIGDRREHGTVELAGHLREVERRLAKAEAVLRAGPVPASGYDGGPGVERRPAEARPGVVTVEPRADEEGVYGAAAPLVAEWRRLYGGGVDEGDRLARAMAEERMRELEIELIERHGLTLPPATMPWSESGRRSQAHSRRMTLARVRGERIRAQWRRRVRRSLTLGMWR